MGLIILSLMTSHSPSHLSLSCEMIITTPLLGSSLIPEYIMVSHICMQFQESQRVKKSCAHHMVTGCQQGANKFLH